MTSPTLMYSTPTAQQFNKKAQQISGNHGASYTTVMVTSIFQNTVIRNFNLSPISGENSMSV